MLSRFGLRGSSALPTRATFYKFPQFSGLSNLNLAKNYSSNVARGRKPNLPKIRYIFLMVLVSYGCLHFVSSKVSKRAPKTSFSEREFEQYEKESGLKRRAKLVSGEKGSQYTFLAVPYTRDLSTVVDLLKAQKLVSGEKEIKVINPEELIENELESEGRYSYLLEDLKSQNRLLPKGLLTALVKQEVKLYMNTTRGQNDTDIVLLNYPQTTDEAIKFENDVADVSMCVLLEKDLDLYAGTGPGDDSVRRLNNVVGYFDIVDKVKKF